METGGGERVLAASSSQCDALVGSIVGTLVPLLCRPHDSEGSAARGCEAEGLQSVLDRGFMSRPVPGDYRVD